MKHLKAVQRRHRKIMFAFSLLEVLASFSLLTSIFMGLLFAISIFIKLWGEEAQKSFDRKVYKKNAFNFAVPIHAGTNWEAKIRRDESFVSD